MSIYKAPEEQLITLFILFSNEFKNEDTDNLKDLIIKKDKTIKSFKDLIVICFANCPGIYNFDMRKILSDYDAEYVNNIEKIVNQLGCKTNIRNKIDRFKKILIDLSKIYITESDECIKYEITNCLENQFKSRGNKLEEFLRQNAPNYLI